MTEELENQKLSLECEKLRAEVRQLNLPLLRDPKSLAKGMVLLAALITAVGALGQCTVAQIKAERVQLETKEAESVRDAARVEAEQILDLLVYPLGYNPSRLKELPSELAAKIRERIADTTVIYAEDCSIACPQEYYACCMKTMSEYPICACVNVNDERRIEQCSNGGPGARKCSLSFPQPSPTPGSE